jgi:phospholipase/carboxylesterase
VILAHRVRRSTLASPRPPLLVLMHGLGSDEEDLFGLAPYVDPRFLVLSLRAPHLAEPFGHSWYGIGWDGPTRIADEEQAAESRDLVARLVPEACEELGADPSRVWVMGFSQGAFLAAGLAMAHPGLVRGIAGHSGGLLPRLVPPRAPPGLAGLPVLLQHGRQDEVVDLEAGREARDALSRFGARVDFREYDVGHSISEESLEDLVRWLSHRLDETAGA